MVAQPIAAATTTVTATTTAAAAPFFPAVVTSRACRPWCCLSCFRLVYVVVIRVVAVVGTFESVSTADAAAVVYAVNVDVVAVPARCRPPALNLYNQYVFAIICFYELTPRYIWVEYAYALLLPPMLPVFCTACVPFHTETVVYLRCCCLPGMLLVVVLLLFPHVVDL